MAHRWQRAVAQLVAAQPAATQLAATRLAAAHSTWQQASTHADSICCCGDEGSGGGGSKHVPPTADAHKACDEEATLSTVASALNACSPGTNNTTGDNVPAAAAVADARAPGGAAPAATAVRLLPELPPALPPLQQNRKCEHGRGGQRQAQLREHRMGQCERLHRALPLPLLPPSSAEPAAAAVAATA
ncbi:hypothetical protein JKP88DRAFT_273314 [Tribonema minus]|uniref:Uncharacterized protein n=1 Tax=Tribonema minus TaxID=303371 RepID=A0A835Z2U5_9STRA|nr:hypothetical protein JKP88DRAFT_273314 [Tribonema minus]